MNGVSSLNVALRMPLVWVVLAMQAVPVAWYFLHFEHDTAQ